MHRALRSGLSLLTTFCITLLLFTGAVIPTGAVEAGDILAPDMDKWGQQNNNGWYYMYKKGTAYAERPFFDSTSEIGWQQNAFASDPAAMGEMFFINQQSFFIGEGGGMPVYAFKAPASGQVELYIAKAAAYGYPAEDQLKKAAAWMAEDQARGRLKAREAGSLDMEAYTEMISKAPPQYRRKKQD